MWQTNISGNGLLKILIFFPCSTERADQKCGISCKIREVLGNSPLSSVCPATSQSLTHQSVGSRSFNLLSLTPNHNPWPWGHPGDILEPPSTPSPFGKQSVALWVWDGVSHGAAPHPSSFTHQEHPVCFQTLPACLSGCLGLALFSVTPIDVSGVALVESGEKFGSSSFYSPLSSYFPFIFWQCWGWA